MEKQTRMTKQKKLILDILRSTKTHPTADWIYEQAKRQIPKISLGTVYRNLKILKEMGEIMELDYGSTYSRFDGNPANHYHFTCLKCGRVDDVPLAPKEDLEVEAGGILEGAEVDTHRLEFYGRCPACVREDGKKS